MKRHRKLSGFLFGFGTSFFVIFLANAVVAGPKETDRGALVLTLTVCLLFAIGGIAIRLAEDDD